MIEKWGALAFFVLAVALVIGPLLYFANPNQPTSPLVYTIADLLSGPVWAVSLVSAVFVMRERLGARAPHRMTLALLAASLAAGLLVCAILIRSANRHYHLMHPDLNLENSTTVLIVWTTIVAGVTAAGQHFLGWSLLLIAWTGWTTRLLPRVLVLLYVAAGWSALFNYLLMPGDDGVVLFGAIVCVWQGILLWRGAGGAAQAPGQKAGVPAQV